MEMLEKANVDVVFVPDEKEMYGEVNNKYYELGELDAIMEGKFRPGHFQGVAQIVELLFEAVEPDSAFFGEKDFQQLLVIRRMTKLQNLSVRIIACPTLREKDGLAMSSRNARLTKEQRKAAPEIYKALQKAIAAVPNSDIETIRKKYLSELGSNKFFNTEYFEIVDVDSFQPAREWLKGRQYAACTAVFCGDVRLIDNMLFSL